MPGEDSVGDEESLIRRVPLALLGNPVDPAAFTLDTRRGEQALSMYRAGLCEPARVLSRSRRPGAALAWFAVADLREYCTVLADPTPEDLECGAAHAGVRPVDTPAGQQISLDDRERLSFLARVTSQGDAS